MQTTRGPRHRSFDLMIVNLLPTGAARRLEAKMIDR
jgi:hypothetical protein